MPEAFQTAIASVSGHWVAVIGVALLFLLVQVALTLRFCSRMRRHTRILEHLCDDFEHGGGGRGAIHLPRDFTWLKWVLFNFPAEDHSQSTNFTREGVLDELDARIAGNSNYLLLQRMGVMAPLLGVVLTVVGFFWLNVDNFEEQSLGRILALVTPLVSGVGAGAVLALFNQLLLHVASRRVEILRVAAHTWFDEVIWSSVNVGTHAASAKAVRGLEQLAESLTQAGNRYAAGARGFDESTAAMKDAATQFRTVFQSFSSDIAGIPEVLRDVRRATAASAAALDELIHVGARAVANLDVSVAAFRTTLDREFNAAAKLHHQSSKALAEEVQQMGQVTELLKLGADEMTRTAQANSDSFQRMDESIRNHLAPGNRRFFEAVQALTGQADGLGDAVRSLSANVDSMAGEFDALTAGIAPSVTSFCDAIENRFGPAVTQQTRQVESVAHSMERLQEAAGTMSSASGVLNRMMDELTQFVGQVRQSHESLDGTARDLTDAGKSLKQTVLGDVAPSQEKLRESAATFNAASGKLAEFMEHGVGPATKQLAMLQGALAGLEETVKSIRKFSESRPDIDRMCNALSRAAEISDAISALPDDIRDIMEQTAHNAAVMDSRGGFITWLSRRPR